MSTGKRAVRTWDTWEMRRTSSSPSQLERSETPLMSSVTPRSQSQRASARPSSTAEAQRCMGRSKPRATISHRAASVRPSSVSGRGLLVSIDPSSLAGSSGPKGSRPVRVSYVTTQSAQRSVRASTSFPMSCSGAM